MVVSPPRGITWSGSILSDVTGSAVARAKEIATVLYERETRSLRSTEVVDLIPIDPEHFKRVSWSDIKGKPISKIAVELKLARSRSESFFNIQRKLMAEIPRRRSEQVDQFSLIFN